MKTCNKCQQEKPEVDFSKNKTRKDGLSNVCKECSKEVSRQWREKNGHDGRVIVRKTCSTCTQNKPTDEFYNDKSRKDGLSNQCKSCIKQYRRDNRQKILEFQRVRNRKNAENKKAQVTGRICSQCKEYKPSIEFWKSKHTTDGLYPCCKVCKKKLESTPERQENRRKCQKTWVVKNQIHVRKYSNNWDKKKRASDTGYRLRRNVMHAIVASMRGHKFDTKTSRLKIAVFDNLPYTSEELVKHLEAQWESWMNWDNYGKHDPTRKTWQIDHIIPQSKLKFSSFDEDNFKKLWALSNLRPLETVANMKKGNKAEV